MDITLFREHPDNGIYFARNGVRPLNEWLMRNYDTPQEHIIIFIIITIMKVQGQCRRARQLYNGNNNLLSLYIVCRHPRITKCKYIMYIIEDAFFTVLRRELRK